MLAKTGSQRLILNHPLKKNILIQKFDWEWFPTTMLELWLFIAHLMAIVFLEVIADIQGMIWIMRKVFHYTSYHNINLANNFVIIFDNLQQFSHCCIYWICRQHQMSDSPWIKFISNKDKNIIANIYVIMYVILSMLSNLNW